MSGKAFMRNPARRVIATAMVAAVVVGSGAVASAAHAEVVPLSASGVHRISGADRFEVSASISRESFASGVDVVYVATGATFADALSGGPVAGTRGAPILLVRDTVIPPSIDQELRRLAPRSIVILGGPASVSTAVEAALGNYTEGAVSRISGANRYEVSAKISQSTFGRGVYVASLATGVTFADALAGAPAVGKLGGPVLLVPGNTIPPVIEDELRRLYPENVQIFGGFNSVSQNIEAELADIPNGGMARVSGADRYAVSAEISNWFFQPRVPVVYIATGKKFADALSGAPAAIDQGGPMLLVPGDRIPAEVATELSRLQPERIVILGGTNSVSPAVESALASFVTPR
jgi:putative cell wall-binding protein